MPARDDWISPALKLLSENLDSVLPAVGGAMEDMEYPDIDELEDMLINKDTREVTEFLETPTPTLDNLYRPTSPLFRKDKHYYRFFIDGSLRTYYLAVRGQHIANTFPVQFYLKEGSSHREQERESPQKYRVLSREVAEPVHDVLSLFRDKTVRDVLDPDI